MMELTRFNPSQIELLEQKLDASCVSTREQGGKKLLYITGWHAIEAANRIFGYDAWECFTDKIDCVVSEERLIGENKVPGWGVTYVAKVRVIVNGITREGIGAGHGIDRNLGLAHESASKEAETDAMKRALRCFGNQFGLALYDKTMSNVEGSVSSMGGRKNTQQQKSTNNQSNQNRPSALSSVVRRNPNPQNNVNPANRPPPPTPEEIDIIKTSAETYRKASILIDSAPDLDTLSKLGDHIGTAKEQGRLTTGDYAELLSRLQKAADTLEASM